MANKIRIYNKLLIFIMAILVVSPFIASAEYTMLGRPGNQNHPDLYERYMVFEEAGKIIVYDFGNTLSDDDDIGVIEIDKSSGNSEPVIDGRYIAWIRDRKDIYVYDMGEDEMINSNDLGAKKLSTFDNMQGRDYTIKNSLGLSTGILVWEDYDSRNKDSDLRGYDLNVPGEAADSTDDPHYFIVSDEKSVIIGGKTYGIDEYEPFIRGKTVVYTRHYVNPEIEIAPKEIFTEIFKYSTERKASSIISDSDDACSASQASIDIFDENNLIWVEYCHPYYRISSNVPKIAGQLEIIANEGSYNSPYLVSDKIYYVLMRTEDGKLLLNNEQEISQPSLETDSRRLIRIVSNGIDDDILYDEIFRGDYSIKASNYNEYFLIEDPTFKVPFELKIESVTDNRGGSLNVWSRITGCDSLHYAFLRADGKMEETRHFRSFARFGCDYTISYGEEETITFEGNEYAISLDGIDSSKPDIARISVNGNPADVERLKSYLLEGIYLFVDNIYVANKIEDSTIRLKYGPLIRHNFDLAPDWNGGGIIAWEQANPFGIYALFIDNSGKIAPEKPIKIADTVIFSVLDTYDKGKVSAVSDGKGGAVVSWVSESASQIHSAFLRSGGAIEPQTPIDITDAFDITIKEGELTTVTFKGEDYTIKLLGVSGVNNAVIAVNGVSKSISLGTYNRISGLTIYLEKVVFEPKEDADSWISIQASDYMFIRGVSSVPDGDGGAIVTWWEDQGGVHSRFIDSEGNPASDTIKISDSGIYTDSAPDSSGGAIITWENYIPGQEKPTYEAIFLRKDRSFWPENPIKILDGMSMRNKIVSDGNGGAVILMKRIEDNNLYALFMTPEGATKPEYIIRLSDKEVYEDSFSAAPDNNGGVIASYIIDTGLTAVKKILVQFVKAEDSELSYQPERFTNALTTFRRGDVDADERYTMGDAVKLLNYLFTEELVSIPCIDAADVDDDGRLTLGDAVYLLNFLFTQGSKRPLSPYPQAGPDLTQDDLGCNSYPS